MQTFYSHGKLLLTGEYVILDGAMGLAIPTQKGQSLIAEKIDEPKLIWKSKDNQGYIWFEEEFLIQEIASHGDKSPYRNNISKTLINILRVAKQLNPEFLSKTNGYKVTSSLEFPRDWGLGSSSTLINNIASWAKIDAFDLLDKTFGGSGYDIACAQNPTPITYQLKNHTRFIQSQVFNPKFKAYLYFVYLNKKQNSRDGIAHYKSNRINLKEAISKISAITKLIVNCDALITFQGLINKHETTISKMTNMPTVKEQYFKSFKGSIKSLGAWGGDFVLVATKENPESYFKTNGYEIVIPYSEMILNTKKP